MEDSHPRTEPLAPSEQLATPSPYASPHSTPQLVSGPAAPMLRAVPPLSPDLSPDLSPRLSPNRLATLGPWYHTVGIVLLLLLYAFIAHLTHRHSTGAAAETPKVPLYASTVLLSWLLLSAVVAGLYHRRSFFRATLHRHFHSRWVDPALGFAIYLSFLTALSILVLLFTSVLMMSAKRAQHSSATAQSQSPGASSSANGAGTADQTNEAAQQVQAVQQRATRILRVNRNAVAALAPHTVPELLLWIALSFTAGFCEEHIFRGYLLSQSLAAMRRFAIPSWLASTLSVLATSALFGSLHLYEGVGGAIIVGLLGATFAVMTLVLGNLRAVIVAHFLQDFLGGLAYYIAHLRHAA